MLKRWSRIYHCHITKSNFTQNIDQSTDTNPWKYDQVVKDTAPSNGISSHSPKTLGLENDQSIIPNCS